MKVVYFNIAVAILASFSAMDMVECMPSLADDTAASPKVYESMVNYKGNIVTEKFILDKENNAEIFNTSIGDAAVVVLDFNRGLEVINPQVVDACFIRPFDVDSAKNPDELEQMYDESEGADTSPVEYEEQESELWTNMGSPIEDHDFLGDVINTECDGRDIFWLHQTDNPQGMQGTRPKRIVVTTALAVIGIAVGVAGIVTTVVVSNNCQCAKQND